ncbi:MAG TPA: hypothetical protein VGJ94_17520 [Syntrophorhabdaceae bacterium]
MTTREEEKGYNVKKRADDLLAEMEKTMEQKVHGAPRAGADTGPPSTGKWRSFFSRKTDPVEREAALVFQRVALTVVITLTLYVVGFGYFWVLLVVLILYGIFWVNNGRLKKRDLAEQLKPAQMFSVGTYIGGLDRVRQSLLKVECLITDSYFVFVCQDGEELGQIPRDSVNRVGVKEGDKILQHLPIMRMVSLGLSSLVGMRKRMKHPYHLLIDWTPEPGRRRYTVFEFTGPQAARDAYQAVNILYRNLKTKQPL